jgi:hypothetical protein
VIAGDHVAGRIYLLKEDSKLLAMEEVPYDWERLLQQLLADHPELPGMRSTPRSQCGRPLARRRDPGQVQEPVQG